MTLQPDARQFDLIPVAKPLIGEEERAAVDRVLASGMLAQGPEVAAFEREFAERFTPGRPVVAVNSGTSGLHLGLLAIGIGPGDEVVVPSFTFAATANAVVLAGATPVFADIDPVTFCIDPEAVAALLTPRTAAVVPVHLFGQPADMAALAALQREHGFRVFEDAAQAHGATLGGAPVGTFGDGGMFSLYPTKNMTAGEGGMVVLADEESARRVRLLRNQGMERQYENEVVGFNARMTDLHAAIGRVQLTKVDAWTAQRRANAAFLDAALAGIVTTPAVRPEATHVYHQYTIRVPEDRDGFVAALREEHGVGSGVYYPIPAHRLPSLREHAGADLPQTDLAAAEVVSLPVHPSVGADDLERIAAAVAAVAGAGA
ncbi:DegT/DnrJ/EryC1/StrS family aminotransferase [Agromyces seonyuensis]|uniref:Aminotransferase class I/II-fold pyridoxal phosphate-dependent enzyme n=1 Tax=Agromyces seonyuensis TaxID=2662446 RepID=A0A6I4NS59_9MICO|nr:DegT/DnrJ/EryC1/StrS family aminotransferase [Agromyces seonyuensis]MWB97266.1 aminotransferase class I/II-fold pyridoxal phosphate-dependent enzyme [Agromyces seonyuensis]